MRFILQREGDTFYPPLVYIIYLDCSNLKVRKSRRMQSKLSGNQVGHPSSILAWPIAEKEYCVCGEYKLFSFDSHFVNLPTEQLFPSNNTAAN